MWLEPKSDFNIYKEEKNAYGKQISFETGVERPLSGLTLYGKSTQVTTTGEQLISNDILKDVVTNSGVTYTKQPDGSYKRTGTATDANGNVWIAGDHFADISVPEYKVLFTLQPGKYTISDCVLYYGDKFLSGTFIIDTPTDISGIRNTKFEIEKNYNDIVYPMLCKGNAALPFEPYTGGKPSPSPEYPQPIKSVGQDGTLEVGVNGGNLFPILEENLVTRYGLKGVINSDGSITITGTPTKQYGIVFKYYVPSKFPAGKYYINGGENAVGKVLAKMVIKRKDGTLFFPSNRMFEIYGDEKEITIEIQYESSDLQPVNYTIYPMLNVGSTPLPFEPYKPKQTLTIDTPNGLPGISINEGGNYMDVNGQHWVCDEIDFGRGKYIQRVKEINLADYDNWILDDTTDPIRFKIAAISDTLKERKRSEILSNRFIFADAGLHKVGTAFTYANEIYFYLPSAVTTVEEAKQWFAGNPTALMYMLEKPIERDLTSEEIASYKAIHTYSPTTIISSDARMRAGYYTAYMETKTNWKSSDFFNIQDYNRIKGNLNEIRKLALTLWPEFSFEEMGEDKSYEDYSFYADEINRFEANVDHICQGTFPFQVGERQTFYDNTPFIGWQELNRLEEACRMMYSNIKSREQGRRRLPFPLNGGVL